MSHLNWLRRIAKLLQKADALEVRENPIIHYFPDVGHDGEIAIDCVITPCAGSDLYDPALLQERERIGKGVARQRVGAMVVELDKYGLHMRWKPGQSFDEGFLSPFSTPPSAEPAAEPPQEGRDDGDVEPLQQIGVDGQGTLHKSHAHAPRDSSIRLLLDACHDALNNLPADGECAAFIRGVIAKIKGGAA